MDELISIKEKLDKIENGNINAILLLNYNNLGDLVCDTPSLKSLRQKYKTEKIVFLVRNKSCIELLNNYPYVDLILEMPHSKDDLNTYYNFLKKLKIYNFKFSIQFVRPFKEFNRTHIPFMLGIKERYGLIQKDYADEYKYAFTKYVVLNNTTTRTEESISLLNLIGIKVDDKKTECFINENNIMHKKHSNYIIVQACATLEARMWHYSNFVELINKILDNYDCDILLTGVINEQELLNKIYELVNNKRVFVYCDLNIDTLLNYIKHAKLVISNDTGPYHFARAFDTKRIVLFGISPRNYLIRDEEENSIEFSGISKCLEDCKIKKIVPDCESKYKLFGKDYNCINTIKPDTVFNAVIKLMKEYVE